MATAIDKTHYEAFLERFGDALEDGRDITSHDPLLPNRRDLESHNILNCLTNAMLQPYQTKQTLIVQN